MTLRADSEERLDRFLARMLPEHSRTRLEQVIEEGAVLVDGRVRKPSFRLTAGMEVTLDEPQAKPAHDLAPVPIPLDVLYEDNDLLVLNKPRGLAAHPSRASHDPTLVNALLSRGGELSQAGGSFRPGIVHRLDKDTTGLLVVAKTDFAHVRLARQIERKQASRKYAAVVLGEPVWDRVRIDAPIARDPANRLKMRVDPSGRTAATVVHKVCRLDVGTLLAVRLETGRTHQIRVHLSSVRHPVLGDPLYGKGGPVPIQLHATFLRFEHPTTGEDLSFFAAPDASFRGCEHVVRDLWESV